MNRPRLFALVGLFLMSLIAWPAIAAEPAVLIADKMYIRSDGVLVAEGNVEAYQGNLTLTATRVTYDPAKDRLDIQGPIRLNDGDRVYIIADDAKLDPQLIDGVMTGARLVLDQQLQLAAVELNRSQGRYTQLYKTVVTSCRICGANSPPIWQIRAEKVIHDSVERQIYFQNAQFRVLDVPIVVLPELRMPDPTLNRATGFLVPSGRSSSLLGIGVKQPYFIALGDDKDLTLTPYLSNKTSTAEWRYRQAFAQGDFTAEGAVSRDTLAADLRAYMFASGSTKLPRDFTLAYDVELTSDPSYLLDYGYSEKDRLDSSVSFNRVRQDDYFVGEVIHYRTLRDTENNATQPTLVLDSTYERQLETRVLGGTITVTAEGAGHLRTSDDDVVGRDIARARAAAEWQRTDILPMGLVVESHAMLDVSTAAVAQDSTTDDFVFNLSPALHANFRWPLAAQNNATGYLLEPVMQLAWSDSVNEIPNEESTLVEFDDANLLDVSRFPASDRVEQGFRLALGTNWTRFTQQGATTRLSLGRVFRDRADTDFTKSSGLQGLTSDWLVAGQIATDTGLSLTSRALFDDGFTFSKAETRLRWQTDWGDISATHIWLTADADEGRSDSLSEIDLSTQINLSDTWTGTAEWQYDIAGLRIASAGLGLKYANECIDIQLAASRRFTSSTTVDPSTDYDFRIGLRGFGAGRSGADVIRKCGN